VITTQAAAAITNRFKQARSLGVRSLVQGLRLANPVVDAVLERRVFVYCNWPDVRRKTCAIADLLLKRGIPAEPKFGLTIKNRLRMAAGSDLWIGLWNHVSPNWLPKNYIFVNAEPLEAAYWGSNASWQEAMSRSVEIWDYKTENVSRISTLSDMVRFVPFGYAPYYELSYQHNIIDAPQIEDIDVLFFGSLGRRRNQALESIKAAGLSVHVVSRDNPVHGKALDLLLARAKIVLGIHFFDEPRAQIADLARLDHVLSNGRFVIHERPSPERADASFEKHVVTCGYDDMAATCKYFVERPAERLAMAFAAREWFASTWHLDRWLPYDSIKRFVAEEHWPGPKGASS
jgi:hypothetical protein